MYVYLLLYIKALLRYKNLVLQEIKVSISKISLLGYRKGNKHLYFHLQNENPYIVAKRNNILNVSFAGEGCSSSA